MNGNWTVSIIFYFFIFLFFCSVRRMGRDWRWQCDKMDLYTFFFFFSSTPTEYAMKSYVLFRTVFFPHIFQLLCERDGMKSFSADSFSYFQVIEFIWNASIIEIYLAHRLEYMQKTATQIEIFGRWNCHTQNRAGHARRDRGFEWKIKRWFCNCINTIVNSSETFFFFFRSVIFPFYYYRVSVDTTSAEKSKRHTFSAITFWVFVFFSVNSLERFHFERGVSVWHTSAAVAAGGITVYGVRFGVNIFYLFIFHLTIHWSDLLFHVCVRVYASIFDSLRFVQLVRIFQIKNWLRTLYKCTKYEK